MEPIERRKIEHRIESINEEKRKELSEITERLKKDDPLRKK